MKRPTLIAAVAIAAVLAVPIIGAGLYASSDKSNAADLNRLATAAGSEASGVAAETPAPAETQNRVIPAETTTSDIVPSQPLGLNQSMETKDAEELIPLRITSDKPEVVQLDRDAVNILVGSDKNLRVVPDTNRTLVLIPKQPGSTYFKALDGEGKIIMQRHIIVGSPKSDYIRVRRACVNGAKGCKEYSVYYCPDMCHEVSVTQAEKGPSPEVPEDAPSYQKPAGGSGDQSDGVEPGAADSSSQDTLDDTGE